MARPTRRTKQPILIAVAGNELRPDAETVLACDFFTVDTVWLRRLYVLFFVSIGTRRVGYFACTRNPDAAWMAQQARNLLMDLDERGERPRFLIHDRDRKFSQAFDAIFRGEDIEIVRTPIQAPNANAHAERWVGSVRSECLDRLLILAVASSNTSSASTSATSTSIVHTERLHCDRRLATSQPSLRQQRRFGRYMSGGANSSADYSTNTKLRHEIEFVHPTRWKSGDSSARPICAPTRSPSPRAPLRTGSGC